jgi:protein-S-isoprenylcysteine O-methyltransferase Ste14
MKNLVAATTGGFLALVLVLAAALFISAGTLRFWQAWLFLGVFSACVIAITAYLFKYDKRLLESRVRAGPAAETEKTQQVIQSLASLCFLGLFIVAGLDRRFGWSNIPPAVSVAAEVMVALGLFIVFLVFRENSFTSATIEVADKQSVVTTGPYSIVRHPMYSGASIFLLSAAVALGSWPALPFAILVILVVAARLLEEEKFLSSNLVGYEDYRRRVRFRLIPGIW